MITQGAGGAMKTAFIIAKSNRRKKQVVSLLQAHTSDLQSTAVLC